ncbi:MAG TPA: VanW family protein [Thermoleophilia bacterium]|nr:VanW family protein [Thermoleophilia bacterium]
MSAELPFQLRAEALRLRRSAMTIGRRRAWARRRADHPADFPHELVGHSSKLTRKVDPRWRQLQENKVRNLELACARLDRLVVMPQEVFSFCGLIGRTTHRRGYLDGLETRDGELTASPGGGLCQLSNLLFWMAYRLDLEILERHRHEMDLFPDDERKVPFGMGATVFYNYCDLQFRNTLNHPLLVRVSVEQPLLRGGLWSTAPAPFTVDVEETWHRFVRRPDGTIWRENRVTKRVEALDGRRPAKVETVRNAGRVMYDVPAHLIEDAGAERRDR